MEPLICIVLVNYNGFRDTVECIKSLSTLNYKNYRIIVVDNASNNEGMSKEELYISENSDYLKLDENIGFAGGNNYGIKYGMKYNPDFFLLLNNDTIVDRDLLINLIHTFNNTTQIGIVTGKIFYFDEKNVLWCAGGDFDSRRIKTNLRGFGQENQGKFDEESNVTFATGCLLLLPKYIVDEVGYMDEVFFLYYEDSDYCLRVIEKGYSIRYSPNAVIYHKESRSTKKGSDVYQYYNTRNHLIMIKRYASNKGLSYITHTMKCTREILRRKRSFLVTLKAYSDFLRKK